ncbi:UNVERIFIED_CONTAM: Rust resistance kinase Lr10 [Sesamum calycinum]|uniref:Rust resistance kinase Lr10 n=1 Tax=Sesamum calycinum TaxID=2727403 RepID=A0AAW2STT8_9LAMI
MSIGSVERGDIGVDIAGPSTTYTPQDYYVSQPPQDYYVPQPSQDDWFQSTSYMPSHAEAYSSHVDLDLGLGINQPYAPAYNISLVPFSSFSAYRDNVESSSAASSSGLHINFGGDDNDGQNEPIQNMGEEIRRPRRQRHRRIPLAQSPGSSISNGIPPAQSTGYVPGSTISNGRGQLPSFYIVVAVSGTGVVILSIIICCCYLKRRSGPAGHHKENIEKFLILHGSLAPSRYKYSEIKKITKSFKDKLGQGGFGSVYQGMLPDGSPLLSRF